MALQCYHAELGHEVCRRWKPFLCFPCLAHVVQNVARHRCKILSKAMCFRIKKVIALKGSICVKGSSVCTQQPSMHDDCNFKSVHVRVCRPCANASARCSVKRTRSMDWRMLRSRSSNRWIDLHIKRSKPARHLYRARSCGIV